MNIDQILNPEDYCDKNIFDTNVECVSKLGDIWQLGKHRLMCGDSTDSGSVALLMNGQLADMVFTDPPYGYMFKSGRQTTHKMLKNDDIILDFIPKLPVRNNTPIYICGGVQNNTDWQRYIKNHLDLKNIIIWVKNNWSMGDLKCTYAGMYEIIYYCTNGRVELKNGRDKDVWNYDRVPHNDMHPTVKPVELITRALVNSSEKGDIIFDGFGGSGSTLIACELNNRVCNIMELDPKYCDIIIKRFEELTGVDAVLKSEIKLERQ